MTRKIIYTIICCFVFCTAAYSQGAIRNDFKPAADSLKVLLQERTTVNAKLSLERVLKRSTVLDFYFSVELGDYPWRNGDIEWFRKTLKDLFPDNYRQFSIGNIYCKRNNIKAYVTSGLGYDGKPANGTYHYPAPKVTPLVTRKGATRYAKGLSGRHIALWQSHGRYYEPDTDRWEWQRAPTQGTTEDLYTQSIVLPFLIPMIENAGGYVMTMRERDTQAHEIIIDNDPSFGGPRDGMVRRSGNYSENGSWNNAGTGFADEKELYHLGENPFRMGSARSAACSRNGGAMARWDFDAPCRGEYAVYVSYKTLDNSTDAAHYTVHHMGGNTEFYVNQKMGGGTWIYLGTFEFEGRGYVSLDNSYPSGVNMPSRATVTADAVKIGGGMGKTLRGADGASPATYSTSGLPSYLEGALYWMQWAGSDPELTEEWAGDYTKDFAGRGAWVTNMHEERHIPFDLSLALHSDAGITPNDSIVGTLAIYTLRDDGKDTYADGRSRYLARELCDVVQTQVCNDIRSEFNPEWTRREIWDRSYSEARTTSVPGMILETLSHQNLSDMEYGHNPDFKFTLARAVYKGILKFLSTEYNLEYAVQPLPVNSISASLVSDGNVLIKWKPTVDTLEPTAVAKSYLLYTRVDDGVFDNGVPVSGAVGSDGFVNMQTGIEAGHIYSYKVVACNDGGKSFPSEIVCAGKPADGGSGTVLIVNDFDRVSGPTWFDSPEYGGFLYDQDGGVGYISELDYAGDIYDFRRNSEWTDDDNPGWGGTSIENAGIIIPGNTFDFAAVHGKALLACGKAFSSASRDAWTADNSLSDGCDAVDLICGKQVTTFTGPERTRYSVFPAGLQDAISHFTDNGGDILISGAYIATDVWDSVYPVAKDSTLTVRTKEFVSGTLGYTIQATHGAYSGKVRTMDGARTVSFHQKRNSEVYHVENPDGIAPANNKGKTFMRYTGNNVPAAVLFDSGTYHVAAFGFPLETVANEDDRNYLFREALSFLDK